MRMHAYAAATVPVYIAANHVYTTLEVGMIPESRNIARSSMKAYIQKKVTISLRPTAVYLLRIWRIIIAVIIIAAM